MNKAFHQQNRQELYAQLPQDCMLLLFSGHAPRKTGDEEYPFFADRSFVYYTGIDQQDSVLAVTKAAGTVHETLYMLPPDAYQERWTGKRLRPEETEERSAVEDIRSHTEFLTFLERTVKGGMDVIYLDFDRMHASEQPVRQAYQLEAWLRKNYPFVRVRNVHGLIADQRTIKKPCELDAMRYAETITAEGIKAMMRAAHDGIYEYQLKAEFDYALAQRGVLEPGFPSIISAGANNFCIHYYGYRGQAHDGDMVLNDVGACWDNEINDVSRGWPLNGKFNERQKMLYTCAYNTSEHMFKVLKPGLPMAFVDQEIRRYNFEQLHSIGVCGKFEDVGTYIWHGGAHHVGYDVHDMVNINKGLRPLEPGMVFCVDVGIYHEEWGIGFRLEDNCLITEDGCECLSAVTPRSIADIEDYMSKK